MGVRAESQDATRQAPPKPSGSVQLRGMKHVTAEEQAEKDSEHTGKDGGGPFTPSNSGSKKVAKFWNTLLPATTKSLYWLNSTSLKNSTVFNSEKGAMGAAALVFNPLLGLKPEGIAAQQTIDYERDLFQNHIANRFDNVVFAPANNETQKFCCFARRATYARVAHWVRNWTILEFDQSDRKKALDYVHSFPAKLTSNPTETIQKWEARLLPQFASLWYSFQVMIQKTSTDETILGKMEQFY